MMGVLYHYYTYIRYLPAMYWYQYWLGIGWNRLSTSILASLGSMLAMQGLILATGIPAKAVQC